MNDLRRLLERVLGDERLAPLRDLRLVGAVWPDAVGPALAQRATPVSLSRGELVVAVTEAAWRQELALLAPEVVAGVNRAAGRPLVQRLRLTGAVPYTREAAPARRALPRAPASVEPEPGDRDVPGEEPNLDRPLRPEIAAAFASLLGARARRAGERLPGGLAAARRRPGNR